jgi:DNA-directed RNA polymerase specialized sigma24 family protein
LLAALDPDRERAGSHYRELLQQLLKFFEWQCSRRPDEQADEVIDRIVRKLAEGEQIANLPAYAYGVAKLLLLEVRRETDREEKAHAQLLRVLKHQEDYAEEDRREQDEAERQQDCFAKCMATLTEKNREIILTYYAGDGHSRIEGRRKLAVGLGTDLNALRVRAHRIRARLEECVATCFGNVIDKRRK